jgi:hypothetical protein
LPARWHFARRAQTTEDLQREREQMSKGERGGFEQLGEQIGETLGETAGRMAGRATDAAMNVAGTLFGSALESLGDWWTTDQAKDAGRSFGDDQDRQARVHFEAKAEGGASGYDDARPLYQFGHVAAHNPDYAGRSFRDVEPQLERAWREEQTTRYGDWPRVREYVGHGFEQRAETLRQTREAGMRAQGGGSSAEADIRVSSRDPLG